MRRKYIAGIAMAITRDPCCMRGWKLRRQQSRPRAGTPKANCPTASGTSGNGATVSIGSKAFAEEQLMAQMTVDVLDAHGFTVTDTFRPRTRRSAPRSTGGTIDMYWQYTGTELGDYLGLRPVLPDRSGRCVHVRQQKADEPNGLCWVAPTQFDDTNGIAIKRADSGTYGTSLAAFGSYLMSHPNTKVCIQSEFLTRPDGLPGPCEHVRLAGCVELPLHADRHDRREGDRQRAVRCRRGVHDRLGHRGEQRGDADRRQEPLPA